MTKGLGVVASTGENPDIFGVESGPSLLERRASGQVAKGGEGLVEARRAGDMTVANTRHAREGTGHTEVEYTTDGEAAADAKQDRDGG